MTPADFSDRMLHANLAHMGLPSKTTERILAADPVGRAVTLADGTPALSIDDVVVGAMPDACTIARSFEAVSDATRGVVVVFGVGMGHAIREIRERTRSRIVVYEPEAGILRTVLSLGPTDLGGTIIVTSRAELEVLWPSIAKDALATMFITPGYKDLFPAELTMLAETIRTLVADVDIIENTRAMRYKNWIEHIFANVEILEKTSPILSLRGELQGVPAFIVAAGPSLDKNAALLAEARKKGIVIAVDVVGRALEKRGLEPHMLVCLEALNLSREMKDLSFIHRVVRACSLAAHPDSLRVDGGPVLPFHEGIRTFTGLSDIMGQRGLLVGGSVSTVAFAIAKELGCSPIVLVGQDLAYSGGQTHTTGTAFDGTAVTVEGGKASFAWSKEIQDVRAGSNIGAAPKHEEAFEVPAWGGNGLVVSTPSFNAFRLWFEVWAESIIAEGNVRLVNATEGGSRIRGFEEETLANVLRDLPVKNIDALDLARRAAEIRPARTSAEISRWAKKQAGLARDVERAARELGRVVDRAVRELHRGDPGRVAKSFDTLASAEKELRDASRAFAFLEGYCYAEISELGKRAEKASRGDDMKSDAMHAIQSEREIANVVAKAARSLARELGKIVSRASRDSRAGKLEADHL